MSVTATAGAQRPDAAVRAGAAAGRWEMAAAALCLAQFSEPLFASVAQAQGLDEVPGYARLAFVPVYAFLAWTIWSQPREAVRTAFAAPLLMGLLALAFISTTWSIDGGATLRRSVWLALTMAFGLYLAWRYSWRELLQVVSGAFVPLIIGTFVLCIATPSIGVMTTQHPGAWAGLWTHKNTMGGIMALGAVACTAAAIVAPERRKLWIACAIGAALLVIMSTSKTSLMAILLGWACVAGGMIVRRGPMYALVLGAGTAIVVVLTACIALLAPELLVAIIGRDLTFTGRTDIWAASAQFVEARPWLGYGYYSFWVPDNGPAYWVREAVQWNVPSAHSGWLETALGMGRIGVALFALQLAATLWRGASSIMDLRAGLWAPAFLAAFALYTMSESHVLQANNLFWTLYVAVAARLALDARKS